MNKLLALIITLGILLCGTVSAQTTQWVAGSILNLNGTNCSVANNWYSETMLTGTAQYLRTTDLSVPKTGDGTYVSILMSVPGLNCDDDGSVTFIPSLVLPPGASLNIDAQNPVICYFKTGSLASSNFYGTQVGIISPNTGRRLGPICPDGRAGGNTGTPFTINANTPGVYGGIALGQQRLTRSSILEIRVPIRFSKELKGSAQAGGDKLQFKLDAVNLTPRPGTPETWINVPYKAEFLPVSSNSTAGGATVSSTLNSYFEAGSLSVDYGTTASFGQTSSSTSITNANESQPVGVALTGLTAGTTYSYRFKYLTAKGTFYSSTGTFVASGTATQTSSLDVTVQGLPSGWSGTIGVQIADLTQWTTVSAILTGTTGNFVLAAGSYIVRAADQTVAGVIYKPNTASQNVTINATGSTGITIVYAPLGSMDLSVSGLPNQVFGPLTVLTPSGTTLTQSTLSGTTSTISNLAAGTYTVNAPEVVNGPNLYRANAATQTVTVSNGAVTNVNVVYAVAGPNPTGTLELLMSGLPGFTEVTLGLTRPNGVTTSEYISPEQNSVAWYNIPTGSYTLTAPDLVLAGVTYRPTPATQTATVNPGATTNTNIVYATVPNLTLTTSVTGSGVISSNPAGINCGSTCSANFGQGSKVTLTASAASGSGFTGWGGACNGTGACIVTMDAAKNVSASFNVSSAPTFALNVSKTGNGTISSTPSGINCGTVCSGNFVQGNPVTLTATPATGSSFTGWGGACNGTGACIVTVNAIKNVTASFSANSTRSIKKPTNAPTDQSITKGSSNNAAAAFAINAPNEKLSSVTLNVAGSGNDATDLTGVHLYRDANANGLIDAGDNLLASGKFSDDNGNLTLTPATALAITGETQFIIAADTNSTIAALRFAPVLGGIFLLGFGVRRRWLALIGMVLLLSACGSTPAPITPTTDARSYQISVTAVNVTDSSGTTVNLADTPISGATLSLQK